MFTVENLTKQYGTEFALNNISLSIGKGMNFIVGASGSGKTTLLKILSGMEQNFEGTVCYQQRELRTFSPKEKSALYNQNFGFVWQDFHLLEDATVLENVLLAQHLQTDSTSLSVKQILKQLKIEDLQNKKVKFLSGGQKQRVAIARELLKNPTVLFCDEPTSALDAQSAKVIIEILRNIAQDKTVIVVTHDTSFVTKKDTVFELDKGELVSESKEYTKKSTVLKIPTFPCLPLKKAIYIASQNIKNKKGHFFVSALSLIVATTLLLTTFSGTFNSSSKKEFDQLLETYGDDILDISLVGSFTNASGGDEDKPNGDVNQDLSGLYEKYQNDPRVEFIVPMQAFENIKISLDGKNYTIQSTGSTPVLKKLLAGKVPDESQTQVVVPLQFVKDTGLSPESAIGKKIDFSATIFQWVGNTPVEKPIKLQATICGVADNSIVSDFEGKPYTFSIDDSFFFNRSTIQEIRKQAGIESETMNFILRAKTPQDLISLKDELNKNGIVPIGRFELIEDIVKLDAQTSQQSGFASIMISILAIILVCAISAISALLRKREYAIYKVSGYHNGHLAKISITETLFTIIASSILFLILSPFINIAVESLFNTSILSISTLVMGTLFIILTGTIAFFAESIGYTYAKTIDMLKEGAKA